MQGDRGGNEDACNDGYELTEADDEDGGGKRCRVRAPPRLHKEVRVLALELWVKYGGQYASSGKWATRAPKQSGMSVASKARRKLPSAEVDHYYVRGADYIRRRVLDTQQSCDEKLPVHQRRNTAPTEVWHATRQ